MERNSTRLVEAQFSTRAHALFLDHDNVLRKAILSAEFRSPTLTHVMAYDVRDTNRDSIWFRAKVVFAEHGKNDSPRKELVGVITGYLVYVNQDWLFTQMNVESINGVRIDQQDPSGRPTYPSVGC